MRAGRRERNPHRRITGILDSNDRLARNHERPGDEVERLLRARRDDMSSGVQATARVRPTCSAIARRSWLFPWLRWGLLDDAGLVSSRRNWRSHRNHGQWTISARDLALGRQ